MCHLSPGYVAPGHVGVSTDHLLIPTKVVGTGAFFRAIMAPPTGQMKILFEHGEVSKIVL